MLLLGLSLLYICSANPIVLEFHWQSARARCPRFPPSTDPDKLLPSQISGLPAFLGYFCDRAQTSALFLPRPATSKPSPLTWFGVVSRCGIHNEHWATLDCVAFITILKQKNIQLYIYSAPILTLLRLILSLFFNYCAANVVLILVLLIPFGNSVYVLKLLRSMSSLFVVVLQILFLIMLWIPFAYSTCINCCTLAY